MPTKPEHKARVQAALRLHYDSGNALNDAFDYTLKVMDGYEFERALVDDPDGPVLEEFIDCLRENYIDQVIEQIDGDRNGQ